MNNEDSFFVLPGAMICNRDENIFGLGNYTAGLVFFNLHVPGATEDAMRIYMNTAMSSAGHVLLPARRYQFLTSLGRARSLFAVSACDVFIGKLNRSLQKNIVRPVGNFQRKGENESVY